MLNEELKTEAETDKDETQTALLDNNICSDVYLLSLDYAKDNFYAVNSHHLEIHKNDCVIAMTKYGMDIARVCTKIKLEQVQNLQDIVKIMRVATEEDIEKAENNKKLEKEAQSVFKEKVKDNKLNMKFVASHFLLEEPKVLFFFSADGRVDFRLLVRDLVSVFKMRVELRQITSREESKIIP